jgi:phosphonopyruvate decarboxylase
MPSGLSGPKVRLRRSLSTEELAALDRRVYRPMTETMRTFLKPAHFYALLRSHGTTFFVGVPDSLLKDLCAFITETMPKDSHVIAANEGTALAMATGHYLATGKIPCVYLQNSGLGNLVNPLLSICSSKVYSIPVLLIIGWRGEPGKKDEPQHLLQGELTPGLLQEMGVPYKILPDYSDGAFEVLEQAYEHMRKERSPFALLVKKQTFDQYSLSTDQGSFSGGGRLHREEVLEQIVDVFPDAPLVSTTGFTSREVFELRKMKKQTHDKDFLTVGGMGHCSSIALGIALSKPKSQVLCVDGDGAAIMHMGSLVTTGKVAMPNFKHILINNGVHDSVGGQPTGADTLSFPAVAAACGYKFSKCVSVSNEIRPALDELKAAEGPSFLEIQVLPGARKDLGRPTTTTHENRDSFMGMLKHL